MYGYISKDANYFNLENLNFNYDFGDGIKKIKPFNGDDGIKQLIHDIKKNAFLEAYNLVLQGSIPPSKCKETAEDILNNILDASRKQLFGSRFTLRDVINGTEHRDTNYDEWIKDDE